MHRILFPDWWLANSWSLLDQLREPSFDGWLLLRYALQALATSFPLFLADYLLGLGVLRLWGKTLARPLQHAAALGLGMGLAGTGIFLLGTLGRITLRGLLILTTVQLALGLALAWRTLRLSKWRWPKWRWDYLLALPVLAVLVPDLMMPVFDYDSTMYHMASARHYKDNFKISYQDGIRFNAQPHLTVMLYLRQWWVTGDANLTKLVNLEYLAILALLFHWMARRFRLPYGGWLAAGLVFGTPIFSYAARVEYADLGLATWLGLGFAVLVSAPGRLPLAALLLGFCAATKLQGHVAAAAVGLGWLTVALWRRQAFLKPMALLAAGVAAPCLGWWWRSYRATGSPVFPFLTDSPDVKNLFTVNATYGVGRDWLTFLKTPWNMIVVPPYTYADLFHFGPSCLILIVLGVAALWWGRGRKIDRGTGMALVASAAFSVLWFRSGQVMRYEACLLPIWAYLLLASLRRMKTPVGLAALVFLPMLIWSSVMTASVVRFGLPPPVTWPAGQGALRNVLPYYRASRVLEGRVKNDERVYLWFCDDARFYFPGRLYGDWFGGFTYTWLGNVHAASPIRDLPSMIRRLREHGFRYVVIDRERASRGATIYGGDILETGLVRPFVPIPGTETLYDDHRLAVLRIL